MIEKNNYIEIQQDVVKYANSLIEKDKIDSFTRHIEEKLSNFKPTLMIYGTYNAGKSTLLNALFGQEEMAKTGDAPETKDVHQYTYNGYTIYDTPGLNANCEDDIVTTEHLKKSEVILFVMSNNGSLEEDYVYNKISEVVKSNKPIVIVLNNKNGMDPNSIESKQSMIKVGENLRKIGDRNNIEKIETKVEICMVNAKTALKGKLENKNLILKKSNILQLENMIEKLLEKSGNNEVINALNIYIKDFISDIISIIDNKIDNDEVKKIEDLITYLEKFKQSSDIKLKNIISKKIPSFIENLTSMLLSGDDIESYVNDTIEDVIKQIETISKNIEVDLSIKIDDFSREFTKITASYENTNTIFNHDEEMKNNSFISDDIKNKMEETLKDKKVIEEGAKQILTKAKEWLPKEVMFGKGPKWIEKAAGKAAIGISVAIEAYNVYSANKEHQQMIENERNRMLEAKNSSESIANEIQVSLFNSIDEMIADMFNSLIISFKDSSRKLDSNNSLLLESKENLQKILNKL